MGVRPPCVTHRGDIDKTHFKVLGGLGLFALIGFLIWVFGFTIEVVADTQKSRFRVAQPGGPGGLAPPWARSARRIFSGVNGISSMRTPTAS